MTNQATEIMTIVDAALYDTEVVDPSLTYLTFFSNTRSFSANGAGTKAFKKDTNLVGMGGMIARGHSMLVKGIHVALEGASAIDRSLVEGVELTFGCAGTAALERVSGKLALGVPGAQFSKARELLEMEQFSVSWKPPRSVSAPFRMKVSLLGVMKLPVVDDLSRERAREIYGRKRPVAEAMKPLVLVHEGCAEGQKSQRDPMTRRAYEAEKIRKLDERGVVDSNRRNTRKAWWCSRCGEKIKQDDVIVAVELRS